jgi:putative transposase
MQRELLDRRQRSTRAELGAATFEWIEAFYNPRRCHSGLGLPVTSQLEAVPTAALTAA